MKELIAKLEHRLERLTAKLKALEELHVGNELNFTYWGGYSMGELKGKISEIENTLDELKELLNHY